MDDTVIHVPVALVQLLCIPGAALVQFLCSSGAALVKQGYEGQYVVDLYVEDLRHPLRYHIDSSVS